MFEVVNGVAEFVPARSNFCSTAQLLSRNSTLLPRNTPVDNQHTIVVSAKYFLHVEIRIQTCSTVFASDD